MVESNERITKEIRGVMSSIANLRSNLEGKRISGREILRTANKVEEQYSTCKLYTILDDKLEPGTIDYLFSYYKKMLENVNSFHWQTKQAVIYLQDSDREERYDAIRLLDSLIKMLWMDISFIIQIRDRVNVDRQIELAQIQNEKVEKLIELADKTLITAKQSGETAIKSLQTSKNAIIISFIIGAVTLFLAVFSISIQIFDCL